MNTRLLTPQEVLKAYDEVSTLYPHVPSLSMWRSWEYAAYKHFHLIDPVLDIVCGDGRFFRFLWPEAKDVQGIDIHEPSVEAARKSGVYSQVHLTPAHKLPFAPQSFESAFANCSIEHMDLLPEVFRSINACLKPNGRFLFSVVTPKFIQWSSLVLLLKHALPSRDAEHLQAEYERYHHLVSAFTPDEWREALESSGFTVIEHIPIMPELTSRAFLFLDHAWHLPTPSGEIGDSLYGQLEALRSFPKGFRHILEGLLVMENGPSVGSGAVFYAEKKVTTQPPQYINIEAMPPNLSPHDTVSLCSEIPPGTATSIAITEIKCWCGNDILSPFSTHYVLCDSCQTLISTYYQNKSPADAQAVYDDAYWYEHMAQDLGLPDIKQRARMDLPERCLHWLRTILAYQLPPATTLELGSSHGGLVYLMRQLGYDAAGLEMSQGTVAFARQTFDVPMHTGPIEDQKFEPKSFDMILMMDVVEHLPDPMGTIRHCAKHLKDNGCIVIQTPKYVESKTHAEMVAGQDPFLKQLKEDEHLFLFSQSAMADFLNRLGFEHIYFEPAIFSHYDMFLVASRQPLRKNGWSQVEQYLLTNPPGRLVLGLLDLYQQTEDLAGKMNMFETAAKERLDQINDLTEIIKKNCEATNKKQGVMRKLHSHLKSWGLK